MIMSLKQRKIKLEPRIKLNHNINTWFSGQSSIKDKKSKTRIHLIHKWRHKIFEELQEILLAFPMLCFVFMRIEAPFCLAFMFSTQTLPRVPPFMNKVYTLV